MNNDRTQPDENTCSRHPTTEPTGIIILSASPLQIVYANERAQDLLQQRCVDGGSGLSGPIMAFCLDLLEVLDERGRTERFRSFHMQREVATDHGPLSLRGVGLFVPDMLGRTRLYVLIDHPSVVNSDQSQWRYHHA